MSFVALGSIADIQLGKMLSPKSKTGKSTFSYLRNQNVQWGRFELSNLASMDFSDRERRKFALRRGDLLICEGGEPGRCAVWNGELADCYYQKALHRVRPYPEVADSAFLSYWIRFQALIGAFEDQNAKTTIAHLPLVRLEQLLVPDVSLQEQRRIAAHLKAQLAAVEEARKAAQARQLEFDRLRRAVLAAIFGTAEAKNAVVLNWPVVPLRDVADIAAGITLGRKTKETELVEVPYLRVANVQDGRLALTDIKTVAATRREIEKWTLRDGDLLLTEGGDLDKLGRGACWREQLPVCIHQNHIFRVRLPEDSYDPDFVSLQVGSEYGKAYFLAHAKKTTGIASINQQVLGAFPLLSPPLTVQRVIAAALKADLAAGDNARLAAHAQLNDIELLPARLLAQAFYFEENTYHA